MRQHVSSGMSVIVISMHLRPYVAAFDTELASTEDCSRLKRHAIRGDSGTVWAAQ